MINASQYVIQSIERISAFSLLDQSAYWVLEDIQSGSLNNEQETVYATGKNGVKIASADRNKAATLTATNGIIVDGVLATQVGSEVKVGETIITYPDLNLTTSNGTSVKLTYKPTGTVGSEFPFIYKRNSDGSLGERYAIGAEASETEFKYEAASNTVTLPTGKFSAGDTVAVFYDVKVTNGRSVSNVDNAYSKEARIVADIIAKDKCTGKAYWGQIVFPHGKIAGNFELTFGDEISVHNVAIEALSVGCNNTGVGKVLWEFYIVDEDEFETVE